MGKKQLIWASLLVLFAGIPALLPAKTHKMGGSSAFKAGYDQGYSRGYDSGKQDQSSGAMFDVNNHTDFKTADIGWNKSDGSRSKYKKGFRAGFRAGYGDGYNGKEPQMALIPIFPAPPVAESMPQTSPSELARADVETHKTAYSAGWDQGYRSGYHDGQMDHRRGANFDADDAPGYKGYRTSYNSSTGKRSQFKKGYRKGFNLGYQDGYSGLMSRLISSPGPAQAQPPAPPSSEVTPPESQPSTAQQAPAEVPAQQEAQAPSAQTNRQAQVMPRTLPKTASDIPLLGLFGFASILLSLVFRSLEGERG
jgi:hypothetical protein